MVRGREGAAEGLVVVLFVSVGSLSGKPVSVVLCVTSVPLWNAFHSDFTTETQSVTELHREKFFFRRAPGSNGS
jgi:hypothetical protein